MEMMDIVRIAAISLSLIVSTSSCQSRPGRLVAEKVDAYDLSIDKQRIAILSDGKVLKMRSDSADHQVVLNSGTNKTGYTGAEIRWSSDSSRLAIATFFSSGNSPLKVFDLATGRSLEIPQSFTFGNPEWSSDNTRLAWIQPGLQWGRDNPRVYVWNQARGSKSIYEEKFAPGLSIFRLKWIPGTDCIGFICNRYSVAAMISRKPLDRIIVLRSDGSKFSTVAPPPGKFTPPNYQFRCWDVSPDGKLIAYAYGGGIWTTSILPGSKPNKISDYWPLELRWSPDGKRLLFVTTTPDSRHATPVAPGSQVVAPPHELHLINLDGTGHQSVCIEKSGIKSIEWIDNREVLYLSGRSLYRNTL